MADMSKHTSVVPEDVSAVVGSEHLQFSSDSSSITHDAVTVLA